ncbi:MAG: hypothetical protein NC177_12765 [Ruminococcus flavefaciens]|nr:hypothetical protein [Ruminococcus flavefaciens]
MKVYYGDDGQNYTLMDKVNGGGAGGIFPILNKENLIAKIFHKREKQRDDKVYALRHLPWSEDIKKFVVLPKVILFEDQMRTRQCGFVMDKVDCSTLLTSTYSGNRPLSIRRRAIVGLRLCEALSAIHDNGGRKKGILLMGDFNFNNIAVDRTTGDIKIIDTDSFHLTIRKNGRPVVLPCTELYPDFFPPEITKLQKVHNNATLEQLCSQGYTTFTLYTDYYCLAYHLHMLLLNCAPFSKAGRPASIVGKNSVPALPSRELLTINGNYCYTNLFRGDSRFGETVLPDYCPDFNIITPELQNLFIRAFQDGARQPELRPTPEEFINALNPFIDNLNYCECDSWNHYLHKSWKKNYCEWCRIDQVMNAKKALPSNMEDILYMTDQELEYFGHRYETKTNKKALAYVLYEVACRYYNRGHNGTSKYFAKPKEIEKHLKKARETAVGNAPELISKIEMLKKLGLKK